jgi:HK97 family phage portal protein
MNLLQQFFQRDTPEAKGLTINHFPDGFYPLSLREGYGSDTAAIQSTMAENELVYACLNIKAQAASDPRLIVQRRVTSGGKVEYQEVPDHPLRRIIARPNARMSEGDLMRSAMVSWDTTKPRRFFAEKEFKRSLLVGIHPLDPGRMEPQYSQVDHTTLIGYDWVSGNKRVKYSLDDLIIRDAPNWYSPAPFAAAAGSVRSDQAQTEYINAFFENGGIPSVYVKDTQKVLRQEQKDEFRVRWRATYGNRRGGQHDIGVLDMTQELQKIGSGLDEIENEVLRQITESRICMVSGVPPLIVYAYVGLLRATYSNLKEAWSSFWDFTMSPALKEWREFWTRTLLAEFEDEADIASGKVRLWWDMSGVAALQDDVDALEARATNSYIKRIRNQNEARAMLNLPPVADGDVFYTGPVRAEREAQDGI